MAKQQVYEGAASVGRVKNAAGRRPADGGRVGIGLIVCGVMGRHVAVKLLNRNPRLEIRWLFDPDRRSIRNARKGLCPEARVFADYQSLCQSPDIDWVMIASWNCFHKEQTIAAFEAGKHVFCQKPLATTVEDCLAMRKAWKASGRLFNIGFSLRYAPHYRTIRKLLDAGTIGQLISMEFNETLHFCHGGYIMGDWRRLQRYAGTHLLEKCCHDIDLANWMTASRAARVASFGGLDFYTPRNVGRIRRLGRDANGKRAYQTWGGLVNKNPFTSDKDIIDNQVAVIEYENGVRATFHTNCHSAIPERRMVLLGTDGAIRADLVAGRIETARIGFGEKIRDVKVRSVGSHAGGDDVLAGELANSMLKGTPPSVGLEEGLASAFTCFGIDEAMESGQVVDMKRYWKKIRG